MKRFSIFTRSLGRFVSCSRRARRRSQPAPRTRPQGRDHRAGALCAQHSARDAEPEARPRPGRARVWLHCRARGRRLERQPDRAGRCLPVGPMVATVDARLPATVRPADGRHRQVLQRLGSGRAHHLAHARRQEAAGDDRLDAGRSQSEGRHGRVLHDRRPTDPEFFTVGATFASPDDEHYYGLGQNHEGFLDHRGHAVRCWHDYLATAGAQRLRAVPRHQQGLRPGLGQPLEDHHRAGLQRADPLDLPGGRPGLVLRDRRGHGRRDLCRLPAAHRPHADAAQGGLRLHPVQAALRQPEGSAGRCPGLPRPPSARRRDGGRLVLLHQDGPDGLRPQGLARSGGHEQAAARDGLRDHDQRLAALCARRPLLRRTAARKAG